MAEEGTALRSILAMFSIGVDSKELKEGDRQVEGFVGKLKEAGKLVAEVFAVHEIKEFIESQIGAAVQLKTVSARLGTTTADLQAYELAAKEAGVSSEALTTGLRFLNRNIGEANLGTGKSADTFTRLHIALKDAQGVARPVADIMGDVADKIAGIQDPAQKTQIAMSLLGRGGAALIPLLNKGGAAFADARKQLVELGGGISEDFIEQAHEAEVQTVRLDVAMQGLKTQGAAALIPVFRAVVEDVTKVVVAFRAFLAEHPAVGKFLAFLAGGVVLAATANLLAMGAAFLVAGAEAAIAAAPFIALALAVEEIIAAVTGNKGLLSTIFGGGEEGQKDTKDTRDKFAALLGGQKAVGDAGKDAGHKIASSMRDGSKEVKGLTSDVNRAKDALHEAKKASDSFFGRGGEGQTPHADIPLNWLGKKLPKDAHALTPEDQKIFGTRLPQQKKTARDFGFGALAKPAAAKTPPKDAHGAPALHPGKAPIYLPEASRGPSLQAQLAAAGVTINQKIETNIELTTTTSDPEKHGKVVGQGVATAQQRANDRARTALRKP